jgi:hypothetical protein
MGSWGDTKSTNSLFPISLLIIANLFGMLQKLYQNFEPKNNWQPDSLNRFMAS